MARGYTQETFEQRVKEVHGDKIDDKLKKELCFQNDVKLIYYLNEEFNKYRNEGDIYFNNTNDLVKYIKSYENT